MKNIQNESSAVVTDQAAAAIRRYLAQQLAAERAEESRNFFRGIRGSFEFELATRSLVVIK